MNPPLYFVSFCVCYAIEFIVSRLRHRLLNRKFWCIGGVERRWFTHPVESDADRLDTAPGRGASTVDSFVLRSCGQCQNAEIFCHGGYWNEKYTTSKDLDWILYLLTESWEAIWHACNYFCHPECMFAVHFLLCCVLYWCEWFYWLLYAWYFCKCKLNFLVTRCIQICMLAKYQVETTPKLCGNHAPKK